MTTGQYVLALAKGGAITLGWGLLLVASMMYFEIELREPHSLLKFLGFLAAFVIPTHYLTRNVRNEIRRRKDAGSVH